MEEELTPAELRILIEIVENLPVPVTLKGKGANDLTTLQSILDKLKAKLEAPEP